MAQRPTRPEGYQVMPQNPEVMLTPAPMMMEPPRPPSEWSKSVTTGIAMVLGIILSTAAVVGGLGRAFYVERPEYTQKVLQDTRREGEVQKTLDQMSATLARQETALAKMSLTLETTRDALLAAGRVRISRPTSPAR
jgi:hypothetical protein